MPATQKIFQSLSLIEPAASVVAGVEGDGSVSQQEAPQNETDLGIFVALPLISSLCDVLILHAVVTVTNVCMHGYSLSFQCSEHCGYCCWRVNRWNRSLHRHPHRHLRHHLVLCCWGCFPVTSRSADCLCGCCRPNDNGYSSDNWWRLQLSETGV